MIRNDSDSLIAGIINKMISGQILDKEGEQTFKKWMKGSVYNRRLMEEIYTDGKLKANLRYAFEMDKDEFWRILITYRAAMHDGMPSREGNFWQRLIKTRFKK